MCLSVDSADRCMHGGCGEAATWNYLRRRCASAWNCLCVFQNDVTLEANIVLFKEPKFARSHLEVWQRQHPPFSGIGQTSSQHWDYRLSLNVLGRCTALYSYLNMLICSPELLQPSVCSQLSIPLAFTRLSQPSPAKVGQCRILPVTPFGVWSKPAQPRQFCLFPGY